MADAKQIENAKRMLRDGFTMDDMLEQMAADRRKVGGMKGILSKLPGGQRALNQMGGNLDEKIFDRNEAIIHSMTKAERLKLRSSTASAALALPVARARPRQMSIPS